ncbi:MAG: EAL domain-containing protein [Gammaproteobacteria bacterium]
MTEYERAAKVITRLDQLDIALSIDDFDTVYSSLSQLSKLPAQAPKINMSLVKDILQNNTNATIARPTIDMTHNLDLTAIDVGSWKHGDTWNRSDANIFKIISLATRYPLMN